MTIEEAIKKVISDNWIASWGNSMGSDDRDELKRICLEYVQHPRPEPLSVILAALILKGKAE